MRSRPVLSLFAVSLLTACPDNGPKDDTAADLWACDETATELSLEEVSALGFSGQAIVDLASGAHSATFTYDDGAQTGLTLTASSPGAVRYIESTPPSASPDSGMYDADVAWDSGANDPCPDRVEVDMTLGFVTEDGAFDESWDVAMSSADGDTVSFFSTLDPSGFHGSFDLADHVASSDWDDLSAWVQGTFEASGTSGEISGQASGTEDCDEGEDCSAWAEMVPVGTWGGEAEPAGECAGELPEADVASYQILLAGDVYAESLAGIDVLVLDDEAGWATFVASFESGADALSTATVDFSTQQVVAVMRYQSSTCGLTIESYGVQQNADVDSLNLSAAIYDASGGCDTACDAIGQVAVVAAVARGADDATGCVSNSGACD